VKDRKTLSWVSTQQRAARLLSPISPGAQPARPSSLVTCCLTLGGGGREAHRAAGDIFLVRQQWLQIGTVASLRRHAVWPRLLRFMHGLGSGPGAAGERVVGLAEKGEEPGGDERTENSHAPQQNGRGGSDETSLVKTTKFRHSASLRRISVSVYVCVCTCVCLYIDMSRKLPSQALMLIIKNQSVVILNMQLSHSYTLLTFVYVCLCPCIQSYFIFVME